MDNFPIDPEDNDGHRSYIVFPFIKTSTPVSIRGITFFPLRNLQKYTDNYSSEAISCLQDICGFFHDNRGHSLDNSITTIFHPGLYGMKYREFRQQMHEANWIITYLYTTPQIKNGRPFLISEYTNMFWFIRSSKTKKQYLASLNSHVWDAIVGESKIYPPLPDMHFEINQDLSLDTILATITKDSWPIKFLIDQNDPITDEMVSRIMMGMDWYGKSCSGSIGESESILFLAMAFETIFGLRNAPEVSARIKESLEIILGHDERMGSWIEQFYTARSKIVHTGFWPHSGYYVTSAEEFRGIIKGKADLRFDLVDTPLIYQGRILFRIVANAILAGLITAEQSNVRGLFISNIERLTEILLILTQKGAIAEEYPQNVQKRLRNKRIIPGDITIDIGSLSIGEIDARIDLITPLVEEVIVHGKDWDEKGFERGWDEKYLIDCTLVVLGRMTLKDNREIDDQASSTYEWINEISKQDLSNPDFGFHFGQVVRYHDNLFRAKPPDQCRTFTLLLNLLNYLYEACPSSFKTRGVDNINSTETELEE